MLFILLGALASIFCSFLPYYIQLLLGMVALIYGGRLIWGEVLLRAESAIVTLTCRDDNTWQLIERSGKEYPAFLCGDSTKLGFVSILRFKDAPRGFAPSRFKRKKRSSMIFRDAVGSEVYRRLLMRLGTTKIH